AETLALVADIPAVYGDGKLSKVVGLADAAGSRFVFSLFDAGEIWVADMSDPAHPVVSRFPAGKQPYDALITPNGRYYIAGLFGEDGLALLDLWHPEQGVRHILEGYGQGEQKLPVYKMPHLRGWAIAGTRAYLPAIGHHELLVVDTQSWQEVGRVPLLGQPVFAMAQPDGKKVWVSFAYPDNQHVQIVDTESGKITQTLEPGRAVLHLEFTPRGEAVWISSRDDNKVTIYDTASLEKLAELPAAAPSGIFFTSRANRVGF
ncbi:MAG: protein nirF, partial [Methylobacillus sp.]|nr:protein nirF [Methylobacillus sp.]